MSNEMPCAQWRLHREAEGLTLTITAADPRGDGEIALQLPMTEEEGWSFMRQADRVLSWGAPAGAGVFTPRPTPSVTAAQIAVERYLVTTARPELQDSLRQVAHWATWVERMPSSVNFTWLINVFSVDKDEFLQIVSSAGATVQRFTDKPDEPLDLIVGDRPWTPPIAERAQLNGRP